MRLLKLALAGVCVLGLAGTANSAEPVKIRMSWVAPVSNWASIVLEKKDLGQASGQVLHARAGPLSGHAADDHGDRQ